MKAKILIISILIIIIILLLIVTIIINSQIPSDNYHASISEINLTAEKIGSIDVIQGNRSFISSVYIADTLDEQEYGLMNKTSIGDCNGIGNCIGMLFVFNNTSTKCFWMDNTVIPLKQFWIINNTITNMAYGKPYSTHQYCYNGRYVLETAANSNITIGDKIYLQNYTN
jgi:uncharacterized membrane protein (UPF0127 family)